MYWYEDEVKRLERDRLNMVHDPEVIFYGSSSIRMWDNLDQDFSAVRTANLGFGGSTLAACVWFFERIMMYYQPKGIVIYAGDNDLGDGRNPEEIFIFYQMLATKIADRFGPDLFCYFISLKPSLSRWHIEDRLRYTNNLIESEIIKRNNNWKFIDVFKHMLDRSGNPDSGYFMEDGLHLNENGYRLWREVVNSKLWYNH